MYDVVLGQEGDDYIVSSPGSLEEAKRDAELFLESIREKNLPTYVYILTPTGRSIQPSFKI